MVGKIKINRADVSDNVHEMCRDWFKGSSSAMIALSEGSEFSPFTLRREIVEVLQKGGPLVERDKEKLQEVHSFAAAECSKETAREKIRQGIATMIELGLYDEINEVVSRAKMVSKI